MYILTDDLTCKSNILKTIELGENQVKSSIYGHNDVMVINFLINYGNLLKSKFKIL